MKKIFCQADLRNLPVLRYLKEPVDRINELYVRYPGGGETGWFAFVFDEERFAWWNHIAKRWQLMSGGGGGTTPSSDFGTGILKSIDELDACSTPNAYAVVLEQDHPTIGNSHFSLLVLPSDGQDNYTQLAFSYTGGDYAAFIRQGESNSYGAWKVICGGNTKASKVDYTFKNDEIDVNNVEDALNGILDKIYYVPIEIVSFSGGQDLEKGSVVKTVNFSWELNREPKEQSINEGVGVIDNSKRSYQLTGQNIVSEKTFILTVGDGKQSKTARTNIRFFNKLFWGAVDSVPTGSASVRELPGNTLAINKSFTLKTGTEKKLFVFAIPSFMSVKKITDTGNLNVDLTQSYKKVKTINVQDAGSGQSSYDIYSMQTGSPYSVSTNHVVTLN